MSSNPCRVPLFELDLVARLKRDDGALPIRFAPVFQRALAVQLAFVVHGVDLEHLDLEEILNGALDLNLVRGRIDLEQVLVLARELGRPLLGDVKALDGLKSILHG